MPENLRSTHKEKTINRRREGRARGRAHHLWPHWSQSWRGAVSFSAQAQRERGSRAWIAGAALWHRPLWRILQQLSCSERHAGACRQAGREVCGHYPARHCWLQHLQNFRGPFLTEKKARQHGAWRNLRKIRSGAGVKKTSGVAA